MKLPFVSKKETPVTKPDENPFRQGREEPALHVDTPAADVGVTALSGASVVDYHPAPPEPKTLDEVRAQGNVERIKNLQELPEELLDSSIDLTGLEMVVSATGEKYKVPNPEELSDDHRGTYSRNNSVIRIVDGAGSTRVVTMRYRYPVEGTGGATINMERSAIDVLREAGYQEKNGPRVPLSMGDAPVDAEVATRWEKILKLNLGIQNDESIDYGYATKHEPSASDMDNSEPDLLA